MFAKSKRAWIVIRTAAIMISGIVTIILGLKATPWMGARFNSSLKRRFNEAGMRVFANLGIRQTWCFHDRWCVDEYFAG